VQRAGGDLGCDAVDVGKKQSREGTGRKVWKKKRERERERERENDVWGPQ
jgi:hypothetical protein